MVDSLSIILILNAELANISRFCVSLPQKNAKSITIYVIFTVKGIEIADFCIRFANVNTKSNIMRRDLGFLKVSDYSQPFRLTRGHDDELNLNEDDINDMTTGPGVYIIVSADNTKVVYPKGTSPVIYIGKADNLRRRLREHLKNLRLVIDSEETDMRNHYQPCSRYQYMKYYGAYVYTFHCLKSTQDAKNLESQILWKFYERYRSLPVGNGARSFEKE